MARRLDTSIPWRVVAIAAGLLVVLVVGSWWLSREPAREPGRSSADAARQDDAARQKETPTAAAEDETDEAAASAAPPDEQAASETPAADIEPPVDEDAPGQASPGTGDSGTLASLAPARAVRGSMSVELYLVAPGLERLIPVTREVDAPDTLSAQVERVVRELIAWSGEENTSPLPPETAIHDVFVSPGGIAYVDFSASLQEALGGGSLGELHAVYGVVASIAESFPEIRAVQILVDHREIDTLAGHVDTSGPLAPSPDWVVR